MNNRARAALQAVGGLGVSLALLVGVPLLLITLAGNPFPTSVPTADEIVEALTQSGSGLSDFVISGLAILLWLLWAQIVIAFAVEIVATMRRRQTRHLPTLPGIQALASRLVASMTLASTLATVPIFAPAVGALNFEPVEPAVLVHQTELVAQPDVVDLTTDEAGASTTEASEGPQQAPVHLQVTRPTELWDIAESVYGDGVAWKQIAASNVGRVDASGGAITAETETIPSDTILILHGVSDQSRAERFGIVVNTARVNAGVDTVAVETDAAAGADASLTVIDVRDGTVEPQGETAASAVTRHTVVEGDTIWAVAADVVERRDGHRPSAAEVTPYWVEVVDANADRVASGDVDMIYPGEELLLPGGVGRDTSAVTTAPNLGPSDPVDPLVPAPDGALDGLVETSTEEIVSQPVDADLVATEPVSTELNSVTAASEVAVSSGPSESLPAGDAANTEFYQLPAVVPVPDAAAVNNSDTVKHSADERTVPLAPAGVVAFGAAMIAASVLVAIRHRRSLQRRQRPEGELPVQPSSAAAAFEAALVHASSEVIESQQGAGWRMLPASVVEAVAGPHELHVEPAGAMKAVPIGHGADSSLAPVALTGDASAIAGHEALVDDLQPYAAASIVVGTNLATGDALLLDLAGAGAVEVEGDAPAIRRFVRTAMLDLAVSNRADDLVIIGVGTGAELQELERVRWVPSFADALAQTVRCGHAGTTSTPVVVIASEAPPDNGDVVAALRELDALVLAPSIDAPVRVAISGDRASIWPDGSTVVLSALADEDYAATVELVECSAVSATEPLGRPALGDSDLDVVTTSECPIEKGPIEVQVLGPVAVDGAAPFSSLKATDVITYLAFHRNGADADQIKTWVWPAYDPPSDKAFANVLSRARTGLGADASGDPFVSRAGSDKTYRLAASVTTDFDRFRGFVALAEGADDDDQALKHLQQALALIRGVPFSGGSASSFAWADNHVRAHVEFTIDEAVHRCADLALGMGELEIARWAARKGLELVPGCEQCFRRRFLVAGADQNRSELRRAMADLERSASADLGEPEAVDTISHDLLSLYEQLDRELVAGAP